MPEQVTAHHTQAHFDTLLARVEQGETMVITRDGRPIAELTPPKPVGRRMFGALRGQASIGPAFFDPLPDSELGA